MFTFLSQSSSTFQLPLHHHECREVYGVSIMGFRAPMLPIRWAIQVSPKKCHNTQFSMVAKLQVTKKRVTTCSSQCINNSLEPKVFLCLPNMKRCMTGTDQNGLFMNRRILQDERGVNSEMILPPVAKYAQTCILEELFPPWKLKLARSMFVVRSKLIPRPFRSHDVGYLLWGFFFRGLP